MSVRLIALEVKTLKKTGRITVCCSVWNVYTPQLFICSDITSQVTWDWFWPGGIVLETLGVLMIRGKIGLSSRTRLADFHVTDVGLEFTQTAVSLVATSIDIGGIDISSEFVDLLTLVRFVRVNSTCARRPCCTWNYSDTVNLHFKIRPKCTSIL